MSSTVVFPSGSFSAGTRTLPSTALPSGIAKATIRFARAAWSNPSSKMTMTLEISFNGGATWRFLCAFTAQGGTVINPLGATETQTSITILLPQPQNASRRVRGTLVIAGPSFTTSGTLALT